MANVYMLQVLGVGDNEESYETVSIHSTLDKAIAAVVEFKSKNDWQGLQTAIHCFELDATDF